MIDSDLDIPAFLRRHPQPETIGATELVQRAKEFQLEQKGQTMTQTQQAPTEKKKRVMKQLPTSIGSDDAGYTVLEGMTLAELAEAQEKWKKNLENVPKMELELRAINVEIRKRAS